MSLGRLGPDVIFQIAHTETNDPYEFMKYISILSSKINLDDYYIPYAFVIEREIADYNLKELRWIRNLTAKSSREVTNMGLSYIPRIQHLDLSFNGEITDEGLAFIPEVKHLIISLPI